MKETGENSQQPKYFMKHTIPFLNAKFKIQVSFHLNKAEFLKLHSFMLIKLTNFKNTVK